MKKVLITGASGMVGTRLSQLLLERGYEVNTLGRSPAAPGAQGTTFFKWDVDAGKMDERALDGVSAIIHLAGANIAEKRWTKSRKQEILDSRVNSAQMIYHSLKKKKHSVESFISASAVGYYGDCGDELVTEDRKPAKDFLAVVCEKWEEEAIRIGSLGIREVRCRNGIVLSKDGGALPALVKGIRMGMAGYFNKPKLYYPWIHIDDICGFMIHAMEHKKVSGAYNTTAPHSVLMKELIREILRVTKSKAVMIPAPSFLVELALGELSSMLLCSQRCSAEKILSTGFTFEYPKIGGALEEVLGKKHSS
ncbi:MAG: TIGR01777 family protein [Bacteroidetes bacterium]|nr:TIGR01777 family protein [Bacteroidota bacterium]